MLIIVEYIQGGRGHWTVNKTGTKRITSTYVHFLWVLLLDLYGSCNFLTNNLCIIIGDVFKLNIHLVAYGRGVSTLLLSPIP